MNRPTAGTKTRSRDPIRTRAAILLAAREVFEAHGLDGARTSEIAKRAKVPQGLLYHYFTGKEDLFQAVLEQSLEPYFRSTIELLEKGASDGLSLLEHAIRIHFQFLREHPHVPRLLAWWHANQGWSHGFLLPQEKAELCERPYVLGMQRIREGQERGFIREELDPRMVIDSFLTLSMHWHIHLGQHLAEAGIDPDDRAATDALHERSLDHIVELVLRGVSTDHARNYRAEGDTETTHPGSVREAGGRNR